MVLICSTESTSNMLTNVYRRFVFFSPYFKHLQAKMLTTVKGKLVKTLLIFRRQELCKYVCMYFALLCYCQSVLYIVCILMGWKLKGI